MFVPNVPRTHELSKNMWSRLAALYAAQLIIQADRAALGGEPSAPAACGKNFHTSLIVSSGEGLLSQVLHQVLRLEEHLSAR